MNADAALNPIKQFLKQAALAKDIVLKKFNAHEHTSIGWKKSDKRKTIDHMIVSNPNRAKVKGYAVVMQKNGDKQMSDHRPVLFDVCLA